MEGRREWKDRRGWRGTEIEKETGTETEPSLLRGKITCCI